MASMPRTVLFMTPSVRMLGGARHSLLGLVRRLDPERYRAIVCCQTRGQLTEILEREGVECAFVRTGWWRKAKYWPLMPLALWRLRCLVLRRNAALIHCNEIYPNPFACIAGRWTGRPVVTHMRLSVTPRMAAKYRLRQAERIIVVSEAAGRDFDHWPDKAGRVETIYNGIDPAAYETGRSREALRDALGWPREAFIAAHVATFSHRKRQLVAIEALATLAARSPRVRIAFVGGAAASQAHYEKAMREAIAARGLADKAWLVPFTEDMAAIYGAADLNLLISGDEGFGRTIIEAGAARRPSLGTPVGGIPELIRDGETGWLAPLDDSAALADRLEWLAAHPGEIERSGLAARRWVETRFTLDECARRTQRLYDRILSADDEPRTPGRMPNAS